MAKNIGTVQFNLREGTPLGDALKRAFDAGTPVDVSVGGGLPLRLDVLRCSVVRIPGRGKASLEVSAMVDAP